MSILNESVFSEPSELHTPQAYTSMVAAATTYTLYTIASGNKARITKLIAMNRTAATVFLYLGRDDFTQVFPDIMLPVTIQVILGEEDLPAYWWREVNSTTTNIVARVSAAGASPLDVQVLVEAEEVGLA